MPTYSYSCRDCGHAFDIQQAFTDDALTACPNCGGSLRKVFGAVGVTFNGSGFYRTDSRSGGKSSGAASSGAAKSDSTSSSSSSSGSSSGSSSSTTSSTPSTPSSGSAA